MDTRSERKRIVIENATPEEKKMLSQRYKITVPRTATKPFTVEDNWINRLILNIPLPDAVGVAQKEAVEGLYDFQRADVQKLCTIGNALNRNTMGLGKTLESVAVMKGMGLKSCVIFTKKLVISHWASEIKKVFPNMRVFEYTDTKQKLPRYYNVDVIITNYEKIIGKPIKDGRNRIPQLSPFGEYLCGREWDMIFADEAHALKGRKSSRTILMGRLPSRYRQALTGTPVKRYTDDLYSILHWIEPNSVGSSYWSFVEKFCKTREGFHGTDVCGLTTNKYCLEILQRLLEHMGVYNEFEKVIKDIPDITESVITLNMNAKQEKLYKDIVKLVLDNLPDTCKIQNGLVKTIRLMQASTNPSQLDSKLGVGPKFEFLGDWLEDEEDTRIVIFSPYATNINKCVSYLNSRKIACRAITGQLTTKEREKNLELFMGGEIRVLACTIGAAGTGTDGLQFNCHNVVFLDKDWSPEDMRQAISRLRRLGQTERVSVYYLECAHTIDQRIGKINIQKIEDIRKIVNRLDNEEEFKDAYHLF